MELERARHRVVESVFVDQKQRILSTFLKGEWLASISVKGMKCTDDPWVSSTPEWLMTAAPLHRLDDVRPDGDPRGCHDTEEIFGIFRLCQQNPFSADM